VKIEFLYFDGCPSYIKALANLKEVIAEENLNAELKIIKINNPDEAENNNFFGSPSIRFNGEDFDGREGDASFNCRIYTIDGKMTGIPSIKYIREKLIDFDSQ
jgi:hypothetical protein